VIVRPTYQFYAAQLQLRGDTRSKIGELVAAGSELREALEQHGVRVVAPEASFADPDVCETGSGRRCLAAPWFSEVTANGDMVVCSDRYGNPDYFIGNIATTPLGEIWSGDKRREVFERVDTGDCFQRYCPRNGRGFQLNRVFHQIEEFRLSGRIDDVRRWIRDLQGVLPRPAHPFFL
jgi:radical SAM protein with 4Fe4S-binding SPASM domain